MELSQLSEQVAQIQWCHSIDLGHGIVTPGLSQTRPPTAMDLPDMSAKTVLDIGAWDGLNSFLAERLGASRVVALDHYAWGVDMVARNDYWDECKKVKRYPDHNLDESRFWREDLPGKAGFDLAREVLGSAVKDVTGDFMTMDLEPLGTFDVVLFLGVLYHLREPLKALERVRSLTKGVAVIETSAIEIPEMSDQALIRFYPGDELDGDFGNYFALSAAALVGLAKAAGFTSVELKTFPPPRPRGFRRDKGPRVYRLLAHLFA